MLARSFVKTVGLPFLQTSVADWFYNGDSHLGAVVTAARRFFDQAIASAPCVAFIDAIDALPDRAAIDARYRKRWTSVIICVLIGIDRMRASDIRVVLIGATNHIRYLDAALVRPGRLDRHVEILGPRTAGEVEDILRFHLRGALCGVDLRPAAEIAFALGMTIYLDGGLLANARPTIEAHVVAALGGRAADVELSGAATAGAMADLKTATRLLAAVHGLFGLGDTLVATGGLDVAERLLDSDPELKRVVGAELDRLMDEARKLARRHAPAIRRLAMLLLERRVASAADVAAALDGSLKPGLAIALGDLGAVAMRADDP